jgi:glycosyltransferase involved in cell wall biosynthesis
VPIETVYYPLDTAIYRPLPRADAKVALGLPPDGVVIGFASDDLGNRRKGFDVLAAALRNLSVQHAPGTSLLSFGRTPAREVAGSIPLPWVHRGFLATDTLKVAAYSAMDIFIAPSRAEAFGQTAIEAMACGAAVVASDAGGLPEALGPGACGLLVPPDQPAALREAIVHLLDSPDHRQSLAAAARAQVVEKHNPGKIADAYLRVCAAIGAGPGNSAEHRDQPSC